MSQLLTCALLLSEDVSECPSNYHMPYLSQRLWANVPVTNMCPT